MKATSATNTLAAGGFYGIEAEEGEDGACEFEPGGAFTEEEDAEGGCGDGQDVGEGSDFGGFEVAEEPEVNEVSDGGAEKRDVEQAGPGLPGDGTPGRGGTESCGAIERERQDEYTSKNKIPGGHGEGVVFSGDAFAQDYVEGEAERTAEGDGIA